MNLVSVDCPACGATLPAQAPTGRYTCDYCGAQFAPQQVKHAHDQAGHALSTQQLAEAIVAAQRKMQAQPQPVHPAAQEATARAGKAAGCGLLFAVIMTLVMAAVPLVIFSGAFSGIPVLGGGGDSGASVGGSVLSTEHLLWDDNGGRPGWVKSGDDLLVLGRTRAVGSQDELYLDAYDLEGERRWRVDGLGSYSDGYQYTRFGVVGDRVLLSDASSVLRILDGASGEVKHKVSLSDRVDRICTARDAATGVSPPESENSAWIEQIDDQSFLVDVQSGELEAAGKPAWCEARNWPASSAHAERHPAKLAPKVDGAKVLRTYIDGDHAVAAAVKSPGTEVPRAIGFDPKTKETRWDREYAAIPAASNRRGSTEFSGLASGRYVAVYGEGQELWHLTALDAESGASLWDVTLRRLFSVDRINGLEVSEDHIFVVRSSSLEVYDAASGELLLTVGRETYER